MAREFDGMSPTLVAQTKADAGIITGGPDGAQAEDPESATPEGMDASAEPHGGPDESQDSGDFTLSDPKNGWYTVLDAEGNEVDKAQGQEAADALLVEYNSGEKTVSSSE